MKYEIDTDYPEYTPLPFVVFADDEFVQGCNTIQEAYLVVAKMAHETAMAYLAIRSQGVPHETD
jgi:hypothetical protein